MQQEILSLEMVMEHTKRKLALFFHKLSLAGKKLQEYLDDPKD